MQFDNCVIANIDVQIEPVAVAVFLADANTSSESGAMIAAGAVPRDEGRHEPIRE